MMFGSKNRERDGRIAGLEDLLSMEHTRHKAVLTKLAAVQLECETLRDRVKERDFKMACMAQEARMWREAAKGHQDHITKLRTEVSELKAQVGKLEYKKLRDYTVTLGNGESIVFRADQLCHRRDGAIVVFWIDDVEVGCASGYRNVTSVPVVPGL